MLKSALCFLLKPMNMKLKAFAEDIQNILHSYQEEMPITNPEVVQSVCLELAQELIALQQKEDFKQNHINY